MPKKTTAPKSAGKRTAAKQQVSKPDTRVVCPVCGAEIAIGEHEHTVGNATVIGADSGLGTVVLPISKRGETLKAAGVDTSKFFSIELPTGGKQWMRMDENGIPVAVTADDPVVSQIISSGTVPNRKLFRRWIMSQVFHGLLATGGITAWIHNHGYKYQWKQFIEELRVQAKHLYGKDPENFRARNRWFNKDVAMAMALDFCKQLRAEVKAAKRHKCKGHPYVHIGYKDYFLEDVEKKLFTPLGHFIGNIERADTPERLYDAVLWFWQATWDLTKYRHYKQSQRWMDAYKGAGAYFTMQNLLRFHGCFFPLNNPFYKTGVSGLQLLEEATEFYAMRKGDKLPQGWRLFGLLKQMMDENHIDISAKQVEWAKAKKARQVA